MSDLRMPDINKVLLAGRLTRDPELRYTGANIPFCRMGLAVSRIYRTKDGERREETVFVDVVAWRATAEYCGERMKKGNPILVEGRLRSNEWEDKESGQKRTKIEVQAERIQQMDWPDSGGAGAGKSQPRSIEEPPPPEDDIPF